MLVCEEEESVRFARSHAVRSRRSARGLPLMSFLYLRLNSCAGVAGHVRVYIFIQKPTFVLLNNKTYVTARCRTLVISFLQFSLFKGWATYSSDTRF